MGCQNTTPSITNYEGIFRLETLRALLDMKHPCTRLVPQVARRANEQNLPTVFNHPQFGNLRTVEINGEPWFVGKDVAEALGYSKSRNAIATHVDEEDKTHAPIQGGCSTGVQDTIVINESGLYSLILSSKLPSAKEFKHWVTSNYQKEIS